MTDTAKHEKLRLLREHLIRLRIHSKSGSRLGQDAVWSLLLKVIYTGLSFLSSILLAKLLGPTNYGVYAYVYALIGLLSVPAQFGLPNLVLRETARGMSRSDYGLVKGIWVWGSRVVILISLGLAGLAGLAAVAIWLRAESFAGEQLATFAWAVALVPLVALGNLRGAALRGLHRVVAGQIPEFLLRPSLFVLLLLSVGLMDYRLRASQAMTLEVLSATVAFAVGAWILWRVTPSMVSEATTRYQTKDWLAGAVPLALISGMNLVSQRAAILTLGLFVPPADIGIYRIAMQIARLASFGLQAVNMVVAPRFAHMYAQGKITELQHLVTVSARGVLALNLVTTTLFVLVGRPFLKLAYGMEFAAAYRPLVILLSGQLMNSAAGSVGFLLNMTGHEQYTLKGLGAGMIANLMLSLLLCPSWGISGAAVATATSMIIWNVLLWREVQQRMGINSLAFRLARDKHT